MLVIQRTFTSNIKFKELIYRTHLTRIKLHLYPCINKWKQPIPMKRESFYFTFLAMSLDLRFWYIKIFFLIVYFNTWFSINIMLSCWKGYINIFVIAYSEMLMNSFCTFRHGDYVTDKHVKWGNKVSSQSLTLLLG